MSRIDLRPLDVLKLGFWNINGLNSKVIGNKLTNQDFSLKMESCNTIGLAETHSHSLTLAISRSWLRQSNALEKSVRIAPATFFRQALSSTFQS